MSDDEIAEIRARHAADANDAAVLHPELSPTWALAGWRAHNDRGYLLAEDARHRTEIERLRAEVGRLREVIRTIRARCVELDDSDAVSEVLDISSAALGDEA